MNHACFCDVMRTPFGCRGDALAGIRLGASADCDVPADAAATGAEIIPTDLLEVATCGELRALAERPAELSVR